jgi:hypothetical protein
LGSEADYTSELLSSVRRQSELLEEQREQLKTAQMEKDTLSLLVSKNQYAQSQIDIDNERLRKQVQKQAALLDIIGPIEIRLDEIMTKKLDRVLVFGQREIDERNQKKSDAFEKDKLMSFANRLRILSELNKTLDPDVAVADMKQLFEQTQGNFLFRTDGSKQVLSKELTTDWFEAYWFHILRSFRQNKGKNMEDLMNIAKDKMKVDVPPLLRADDAQTALDNYMKKLTLEYYFDVMER